MRHYQSGWWNTALQRIIQGVLWISSTDFSVFDLQRYIESELYIRIDDSQLHNQVNNLCQSGDLVQSNGKIRLSESTRLRFEKEIERADEVECSAFSAFKILVEQNLPEMEAEHLWGDLNNGLIIPAIKQMGARFYDLLTGENSNYEPYVNINQVLKKYPESIRGKLQIVFSQFLSKKDVDVRSFILRQLYTSFAIEASNLSDDSLCRLSLITEERIEFFIFVDTNFVFSFFDVHDNPLNDETKSLINVMESVSEHVSAKLLISPHTVDETRSAFQNTISNYEDLRVSPNIARASLKIPDIGGFLRKLSLESIESGQTIAASDFFNPYKTNLIDILEFKGINLYDVDLSMYGTSTEVVEDILRQMDFEDRRYGEKAKSYEKVEHDIILWHLVSNLRPRNLESAIEAKYFIVTIDYRFLGFDSFKRQRANHRPQVCLLPSQLIQLLQFWTPRTAEFENALFDSWLWPLLFQDLDIESEKITIRILQALSRFEDIEDLPEQTVSQILLNSALRQRIALEGDLKNQIELLKEALVDVNRATLEKLEEQRDLSNQQMAKITELQDILEDEKESARLREKNLAKENVELSDQLNRWVEVELKRKEIIKFIRWNLIRFLLGSIVLLLIALLSNFTIQLPLLNTFIILMGMFIIFMLITIEKRGSGNKFICQTKIFQIIVKIKNYLITAVGFIVLFILEQVLELSLWPSIHGIINRIF